MIFAYVTTWYLSQVKLELLLLDMRVSSRVYDLQ